MKNNQRIWTSFAICFLGIWLLAAPATFRFQREELIISDWVAGALFIILGLWARRGSLLISWLIGIIGIWLQFAPLIFWAPDAASYLNDTFIGALAIVFSLLLNTSTKYDEDKCIPPGWSYNPSSWAQRAPIALFIFICWMISRYLAAFELGFIDVAWDPFFGNGTERVLTSNISKDFPVPDAGLGAFAYTLEFLSTCQGGKARWKTDPWLVLIFGTLVIPVGFTSVCLIILQPLDVGTWCTLCLTTAVFMLIAIPFAIDEVTAALQFLKHDKSKPFFPLLFSGDHCERAKSEEHPVDLSGSIWKIFKEALKGITFPFNLVLTAFIGITLMILPWPFHIQGILKDFDPIFGAFTIVFSVISFSEITRKLRFVLLGFSAIIFITALVSMEELTMAMLGVHIVLSALLGGLSFRRGHFLQKTKFE